ncbi:MAG: hypothetical protein LQ350_006717 [Teloschistes chrysophthalmus]|nr:MAG: hypothetical protein LQ350_006717 [Niorma chrysophthalma]
MVSLHSQPLTAQSWLHGPSAPSPRGGTPGAPMLHENNQSSWFNITYQTQSNASTFGPVLATEVKLGGLSIPDFGVGVATQLAFGYPLDGFMGLAFKGLNTGMRWSSLKQENLANDDAVQPKQQPTIMEAAQQYLEQPVFTVGLRPNSQGTLSFGFVDNSLYQGNLISAPINASQASWVVDSITLFAGSATVTQSMLFDTGGSDTMTADPTFVDGFWAQVSGAQLYEGSWIYPCASFIPNMVVSVAPNQSHEILGSTFNAGQIAEGVCRGALQGTSGIGSAAAPFFLTFFVVFNQATPSISFANQP